MPICFLRRDRKDVDLDGRGKGEGQGVLGGGETVIRIYCTEKRIFNKSKRK